MAQSNKKLDEFESPLVDRDEWNTLQSQAVAIDPPPSGAIGIQELLNRFERFAEARALVDSPEPGAIGVRELLTRLGNLADAGYFSPTDLNDTGEK